MSDDVNTIGAAASHPQPGNGRGDGFMAWFDYLIRRKEMPEATASALRTGARRVLEVEQDLTSLDVLTLDADDLLRRFRNAAKGDISQSSVDEYERRFRLSLDSYRRWVGDDPDWLPKTRRSSGVAQRSRSGSPRAASRAHPMQAEETEPATERPAAGLVVYPFPVRLGVQARLALPDDLTAREAKRLSAFIDALALAEPLAITRYPRALEHGDED